MSGAQLDVITRTVGTGSGGYISQSVPTARFAAPFARVLCDRNVLIEVVGKLRDEIAFRIAYGNHLLSGEDDEAWEAEAEQFAREAAQLTPLQVAERLDVFRRLLPDWDVSVEEFADFWAVTPDEVLEAARSTLVAPAFPTYSNGSITAWLTPQSLQLKGNE